MIVAAKRNEGIYIYTFEACGIRWLYRCAWNFDLSIDCLYDCVIPVRIVVLIEIKYFKLDNLSDKNFAFCFQYENLYRNRSIIDLENSQDYFDFLKPYQSQEHISYPEDIIISNDRTTIKHLDHQLIVHICYWATGNKTSIAMRATSFTTLKDKKIKIEREAKTKISLSLSLTLPHYYTLLIYIRTESQTQAKCVHSHLKGNHLRCNYTHCIVFLNQETSFIHSFVPFIICTFFYLSESMKNSHRYNC